MDKKGRPKNEERQLPSKSFETYLNEEKDTQEIQELAMELTPLQVQFAEAFVKNGGNASEAVRQTQSLTVKNANKMGHRWANDPKVQRYIALCYKLRAIAVACDSTELVQKARATWLMAMEAKDFKEANAAVKLLNELISGAGAKQYVTNQTNVQVNNHAKDVEGTLDLDSVNSMLMRSKDSKEEEIIDIQEEEKEEI